MPTTIFAAVLRPHWLRNLPALLAAAMGQVRADQLRLPLHRSLRFRAHLKIPLMKVVRAARWLRIVKARGSQRLRHPRTVANTKWDRTGVFRMGGGQPVSAATQKAAYGRTRPTIWSGRASLSRHSS